MAGNTYRNRKVENRTLKTNVKRDNTYKSRKVENRAGQTKSIKRDGIPADKIPPYDSNTSSVLKCTWRRRVMDITISIPQCIDTLFQKPRKRKKDNVIMKNQDSQDCQYDH